MKKEKMEKVVSDLEKMNKDRRRAEEEYLESQQAKLEMVRIQREGISNVTELLKYIEDVIESVKHSEDLARLNNNPIVYSEAIGIKREFEKLGNLVVMDGSAMEVVDENEGERQHRANNEGEEGYQ